MLKLQATDLCDMILHDVVSEFFMYKTRLCLLLFSLRAKLSQLEITNKLHDRPTYSIFLENGKTETEIKNQPSNNYKHVNNISTDSVNHKPKPKPRTKTFSVPEFSSNDLEKANSNVGEVHSNSEKSQHNGIAARELKSEPLNASKKTSTFPAYTEVKLELKSKREAKRIIQVKLLRICLIFVLYLAELLLLKEKMSASTAGVCLILNPHNLWVEGSAGGQRSKSVTNLLPKCVILYQKDMCYSALSSTQSYKLSNVIVMIKFRYTRHVYLFWRYGGKYTLRRFGNLNYCWLTLF